MSTTQTAADWMVFPCHSIEGGKCTCGRSKCHSPGKHPRTPNGLKDATNDPAVLAEWWERWPQANLAVATGEENAIVVVDIDADKSGFESLLEIEEQHGQLPGTVEARTGGGGLHLYYRYPPGEKIGSRNGWRQGVDVKADGGYVICPPSNHISGNKYRWAEGRKPGEIEIAEIPDWLLELLPRKKEEPKSNGKPHESNGSHRYTIHDHTTLLHRAECYVAKAEAASEGNRNEIAFRLAGHVAAISDNGSRLSEADIFTLLGGWNLRNAPPLPDDELQVCVASAMQNGTARPDKESNHANGGNASGTARDEPRPAKPIAKFSFHDLRLCTRG